MPEHVVYLQSLTSRASRRARSGTLALILVLAGAACGSGSEPDGATGLVDPGQTETDEPQGVDSGDEGPQGADDTTADDGDGTAADDAGDDPALVDSPAAWTAQPIVLTEIATLDKPLALVGRSGTGDLYVAEKGGVVRHLTRTVTKNQPDRFSVDNRVVVDISDEVGGSTEQGLLDIQFSSDGRHLFVSFTNSQGANVVRRYTMSGNSVRQDSAVDILNVDQPFANHNGGGLAFGPDGFLYVGLGDGGRAGDPLGSGQDPATLLGSILRIDPDGATGELGYSIPNSNPFIDAGGAPEVWIYGARNPWRFSFDPANGDLWIADVGQDRFEEVNLITAASGGGAGVNLGWNQMEGFEEFDGGTEPANHTGPILAYAHDNGRCSVTGGEVYRGDFLPALTGVYIFGDFCSGEVFGAQSTAAGTVFRNLDITVSSNTLVSFGTDENDEMYLLSLDGGVFRLEAPPEEE